MRDKISIQERRRYGTRPVPHDTGDPTGFLVLVP